MTTKATPSQLRMTAKYRPRMRTVLLALNLIVLALPVAGLYFFRIFENQLVRETESELISQGALIGAFVKAGFKAAGDDAAALGVPIDIAPPRSEHGPYTPIMPERDLARDEILPPRPAPVAASVDADLVAAKVGRALSDVFLDAQKVTMSGLRLLDQRGTVIGGRGDLGLSFAHLPEVQGALLGKYTSVLRRRISDRPAPALSSISRGQFLHLFVAYPIVHEQRLLGVAYLSRTPDNSLRRLYAARERVLLGGAGILALTLLLGYVTSRTIAQPITALIDRSRRMSAGDLTALEPLAHAGTRELAELSDSFSDMSQSLHQRARYVRDFATHVSHEFKTPLTSIRGAAELMAEHADTMPADARARFARNILEDTDRLRSLVERLHELARAEHATSLAGTSDIGAALARVQDEQATASFQITLNRRDGIHALIPEESFEIVTTNLIANAIQGGATTMEITVASAGGHAEITLTDNGSGIDPAHREHIFEPLFTTRRGNGGTGLGLGIVRSILETYRGSIVLSPGDQGATFIVPGESLEDDQPTP